MTFSQTEIRIDRELSALATAFPFLLLITPTNAAECKARFLDGDRSEPAFEYREIPDLGPIRRALAAIDVEAGDDPTLRHLFAASWRDLNLRLDMLEDRGTTSFREGGIELFGHVESSLVAVAEDILSASVPAISEEPFISGEQLVSRFEAELDHYRRLRPTIESRVELRDDATGLMVSNGDLLIGSGVAMRDADARTVAHHEIGVHVLTHVNGMAQPLHLMGTGLAHYDELQEALGLVCEYLAGGLRWNRLRVLAARVVAADHLAQDPDFASTFGRLREAGVTPGAAFTTTMRARRGGGLTKDAIYLRGLGRLLEHLASGGRFETLFLGKASLEDLPLIEDLYDKGRLEPLLLRPRVLDLPGTHERLQALRRGIHIIELGGLES